MKRVSFIRATLLLLGLITGCSQSDELADGFIRDLGKVNEALKSDQVLRMDTVNKGEWDRMFVFSPYTALSEIEAALKQKAAPAIENFRLEERDDINLIVFLNGDKITIVAAVPRSVADFSISKDIQPISRSASVFKNTGAGSSLIWDGNK